MNAIAPRSALGSAADVAAEVRDLTADAYDLLGHPEMPSVTSSDVVPVKATLGLIWDRTMNAMRSAETLTPDRIARLTGLLARVRELESIVDDARVADGVEMIRRIRRALAHINAATTVDDLFSLSVEEACTLGFDRVLISTVDDGVWRPQRMFIEKDPDLAEEIVTVGQISPPTLDGSLVETDFVERGQAGLVYDVQENPRVAKQFVSLSSCTSYGIAPICSRDRVVGMVHADSFYANHRVDATDRAVLNLFGEGLGQSLARIAVIEGLNNLRSSIDLLGQGAVVTAPQTFSLPLPTVGRGSTPRTPSVLSERETDVIELLASGDSNRMIAKKLCISEGTVKTHITHILRKLDASNRAEAVAYWLRRPV